MSIAPVMPAGRIADTPAHATLEPSPWIVRFARLIAPGSRLLDLACGQGRHARWFAARGCRVVAVDRDAAALGTLAGVPGIEPRQLDLESQAWPLHGESFDAIVVANYLHRQTLPALLDTLRGGGTLLYETFAAGNETYGRPANPQFLLSPGELLERVRGRLTVVAFEQGVARGEGRTRVVQRLAAVGPAYAWPPPLEGGVEPND